MSAAGSGANRLRKYLSEDGEGWYHDHGLKGTGRVMKFQ
jgi:hypothetical protein